MSKYEVTFEEYDRFAIAEGKLLPYDQGWGRGNRPVINVSWDEARSYVEWLSKETGNRYRLPTDSEWEYAARSGNKQELLAGTSKEFELRYYAVFFLNSGGRTDEVGMHLPNEFDLHDLSGNVWEWVEDCRHTTYEQAPKDGSAWLDADSGDCVWHVTRGGAWNDAPESLRASNRSAYFTVSRHFALGFRLAQDIP